MQWDAFYPYIEPFVLGCPAPAIDQAVREASIDFCNRTLVWYDTRSLTVIANDADYILTKPSDSEITQVLRIAPVGRAPLIGLREQELDDITDWEVATSMQATHYHFISPGRVRLYPIPTVGATLRVRAAYRPSFDAGEVPDFVFESWRECIVQGAISALKALPGERWSDPLGADKAAVRFSSYATRARADRERGHHKGTLQVAPRRFC